MSIAVAKPHAIPDQTIVALIFTEYPAMYFSIFFSRQVRKQADNPRYRIGTKHQTGGTFYDFSLGYIISIYFDTMFITPLLPLLPDPIVQSQYPVISQTPYEGFGDIGACFYSV